MFAVLYTGLTVAAEVVQTPRDLIVNQQSALFQCSHKTQSHDVILWYRQSENRDISLLGYLNTNIDYTEDDFQHKIKLQGDGRDKANLTIENPTLEDSAVYFCASKRHSVSDSYIAVQKPLLGFPGTLI